MLSRAYAHFLPFHREDRTSFISSVAFPILSTQPDGKPQYNHYRIINTISYIEMSRTYINTYPATRGQDLDERLPTCQRRK